MPRVSACAVLFVLVACGLPHAEKKWPPGGGGAGGDRELPPSITTTDDRMARKVVNAKESPATLIATDRTRCEVTAKRFREAVVGTEVWCAWK